MYVYMCVCLYVCTYVCMPQISIRSLIDSTACEIVVRGPPQSI